MILFLSVMYRREVRFTAMPKAACLSRRRFADFAQRSRGGPMVFRILSRLIGRRGRRTGAKTVVPFRETQGGGAGRSNPRKTKTAPMASAGLWRSGSGGKRQKQSRPPVTAGHSGAARLRRSSWGRLQTVLIGGVLLAVAGWYFALEDQSNDLGIRVIGASGDTTFGGRVTRIVDGDTFHIRGQNPSIRIWGLDAPETGEQAGAAATAALSRLISGQTLQCFKRDIDGYGRIVGQCWLPDGRDITAAMIASGTAREYCRFSGNHYGTC